MALIRDELSLVHDDERIRDFQEDAGCVLKFGKRAKKRKRPIRAGSRQRPGWTAALPIYVVWCPDCDSHSVTHAAGYGRISCHRCHRSWKVMTWPRFRDKWLLPFLHIFPRVALTVAIVAIFLLYVAR